MSRFLDGEQLIKNFRDACGRFDHWDDSDRISPAQRCTLEALRLQAEKGDWDEAPESFVGEQKEHTRASWEGFRGMGKDEAMRRFIRGIQGARRAKSVEAARAELLRGRGDSLEEDGDDGDDGEDWGEISASPIPDRSFAALHAAGRALEANDIGEFRLPAVSMAERREGGWSQGGNRRVAQSMAEGGRDDAGFGALAALARVTSTDSPRSRTDSMPQTPTSESSIKSLRMRGVLLKRRDVVRLWPERPFALKGNLLAYYIRTTDRKPRGVVRIEPTTTVRSLSPSIAPSQVRSRDGNFFPFELRFAPSRKGDRPKVYTLAALSEHERERWIYALRKASGKSVYVF